MAKRPKPTMLGASLELDVQQALFPAPPALRFPVVPLAPFSQMLNKGDQPISEREALEKTLAQAELPEHRVNRDVLEKLAQLQVLLTSMWCC